MTACDAAGCTEPATHHLMGRDVGVHACDRHFATMRPLVPHAGEPMSVAKRALCDVLEAVIETRMYLDSFLVMQPAERANMALSVLGALTDGPNTRELLRRYLEEMST